jgi:U3 small nucleolar RNA-associated protein 14
MQKKMIYNKPKQAAVHFTEVNLDEDESVDNSEDTRQGLQGDDSEDENLGSEGEGDDDEFIDILDILDGRGGPDNESDSGQQKPSQQPLEDSEKSDDEDEDEDEDTDAIEAGSNLFVPSDDEEEIPDALNGLNDFISNLDTSKKRKSPEPAPDTRPRKRRAIAEQTEAGPENEFRVRPSGAL